MISYRYLKTLIVSGIVILFTAGCRTPVITYPSGNITIDAGDSISFISETYPNAIYKWTFDGGAKDVLGQNPTVQFNKAGVYRACLYVVYEDLESGIDSLIVTVNGPSYGALVEKSGQTTSYRTGDDGDEQAGVSWPNPRFTDNSDGTVTDNLTGLVWLKQANYISTGGGTGKTTWSDAVDFCKALASGTCGLSDGSSAGDWRLPNIKELQSLIDYSQSYPPLPSGHPFTSVQSYTYWSSTDHIAGPSYVWQVFMNFGYPGSQGKSYFNYVWPIRDGN